MSKKTTKRSLLASVFALVLCVAMLIGSTFAWFTDTASTGVNKIVSGKLDVGLEYWGVGEDGKKTWLTAEDAKDLFDKNAVWEPGYTQITYLKVKNNGNLALNYAMQITPVHETVGVNVNGDQFRLSDYIQFGWAEITAAEDGTFTPFADRAAARTAVGTGVHLGESLHRQVTQKQEDGTSVPVPLNAGAEELVALVAWMPEDVGNEANYGTAQPTIELTLKVLATQAAVESDSFDNTYDAAAATEEGLDSKPEYDYESLYDYGNLEGYGVTVEKNGAGKVVKATVSGVNGKVLDGFFYNNRPGTEATPIDRWRDLEEVVIEEGVTEIGVDAFSVCTSLKKVTLPESLQKIGEKAFSYCTSLNEINIPNSVNVIGPKAFFFCKSLTSVNIPEGVTEISYAAFGYAESLNTVNLPTSVTKIGNFAFQNCGFTSMNVPTTVKELGEGAFSTCRSLTDVTVASETVGKKALYFCDALTNVTLTDDVKTIGEEAFRHCTSLESIEIPSSVTELGTCAFKNCIALKQAVIKGGTVKGSRAADATFYNCPALESLVISDNGKMDATFKGMSVKALRTLKVYNGEIGASAFVNHGALKSVVVGENVTSIGDKAFGSCKELKEATINTESMNGCIFYNSKALNKVTFGNGVEKIPAKLFNNCAAMQAGGAIYVKPGNWNIGNKDSVVVGEDGLIPAENVMKITRGNGMSLTYVTNP